MRKPQGLNLYPCRFDPRVYHPGLVNEKAWTEALKVFRKTHATVNDPLRSAIQTYLKIFFTDLQVTKDGNWIAFNCPLFIDNEPYCNQIALMTKEDAINAYKRVRVDGDKCTDEEALSGFMQANLAWEVQPKELDGIVPHQNPDEKNTTPTMPSIRPLDLSNCLRHAFMAGFEAAASALKAIHNLIEPSADKSWTEYDPSGNKSYERVVNTLKSREPIQEEPVLEYKMRRKPAGFLCKNDIPDLETGTHMVILFPAGTLRPENEIPVYFGDSDDEHI